MAEKSGIISDSTTTLILGAGVIFLLYKSDFFSSLGKGVNNVSSGVGDIGTGLGMGFAGIGQGFAGIGGGVNNLGLGLGYLGAGLGTGLAQIGAGVNNLATGVGNTGFQIDSNGNIRVGLGANNNYPPANPVLLTTTSQTAEYSTTSNLNLPSPKTDVISSTKASSSGNLSKLFLSNPLANPIGFLGQSAFQIVSYFTGNSTSAAKSTSTNGVTAQDIATKTSHSTGTNVSSGAKSAPPKSISPTSSSNMTAGQLLDSMRAAGKVSAPTGYVVTKTGGIAKKK